MISFANQTQVDQNHQLSRAGDSSIPKVSVIIPNYNHTRFITGAIQSVLTQTYRSFEIIVVDDGSTDNSREVVAQFGNQVRYIWQENQGLGAARNTGIRAATGELIGLLDADDQWQPTFLETIVSLVAKYPQVALYYSGAQGMDATGHDLPYVFGEPVGTPETTYHTLLRANFLIPSTVVMRRSIVLEAGLFDQTIRSIHGCEDWDLWLRIAPKYHFVGTPECLVRYRLHGGSLSANPAGMQRAVRAVIEKHFGSNDGQWQTWPPEKRRAYGGVYRYHLLTSVQRQADWQAGAHYFQQALQTDPSLAVDLNLFYDLAADTQLSGHRGNLSSLNLEYRGTQICKLLDETFSSSIASDIKTLRRQSYGTAYFALGLVAYNNGQQSLSRSFLSKALYYRPNLFHDTRVTNNLAKSLIGNSLLDWLKSHRS